MSKKLILIGASGHGKVIADIAKKNGYTEIAFLDDNAETVSCSEYSVLGKSDRATDFPDCDFIVSVGNAAVRRRLQEQLERNGLSVVSLIHPNAVVASGAVIGKGTVVMAGAVINPDAQIGDGCIINTCSSVDHDCIVNDYVHIAVGAHVAGSVTIGSNTWIGAGATVINNIKIASDCMIGAGAVVVKDITEAGTYKGVPARRD
ncbi:MAG: acetyltransferase [Clostridia bacterium]|nr:acetyltransferase [Clostridia bacterium]